MAEPRALDAMAQLPALVEAAVRADRESGGEEGEGEGEEEVYVVLDFSSAELPPGVELRGDLAIDVCGAPPRSRLSPRLAHARCLFIFWYAGARHGGAHHPAW